jgi:uncharacterized RDD family membrane protein YckC
MVWRENDQSAVPARQFTLLAATFSRAETAGLGYARAGESGEDSYAGFWRRFGAAVVDGIIGVICCMVIGFLIGFVIGAVAADQDANAERVFALISFTVNFAAVVFNWLYFAFFESSRLQATPGKLAVGLRVTDVNGQQISFLRATGRHFGKILSSLILFVGYMMAGWTARKQALHDMMADCLVLNRKR